MSKGCGNTDNPKKIKQLIIEGESDNKAITAIIKQHAKNLESAGVSKIEIQQDEYGTRISPDIGANKDLANAAMREINKSLKGAGVSDFQEAAIMRCMDSPIRLYSNSKAL